MPLHAHEWGDPAGAPLLCLHGITSHGGRFRVLADRLDGRRIVAPDLRGHGRSTWDEPWTVEAHVEDVLATADAAGVERGDWLGYSFGGRVLLELVRRAPERVERAVFLDPAWYVPPEYAVQLASLDVPRAFRSPEQAVEERLAALADGEALRPLVEEETRAHLMLSPDGLYRFRYSTDAVARAWREMTRRPPAFGVLRVPTLLVVGEDSKLVNAAEGELLRRALGARAAIAVVPGGHGLLWDALEETAGAIRSFLSEA